LGRLNKGLVSAVFAVALAVGFPADSLAQVKVILSNGFGAAYREALPEFEKDLGHQSHDRDRS
jgi:hypothetical protein